MQTKQRKPSKKSTPVSAHRYWEQGIGFAAAQNWVRAEEAFAQAARANPKDDVYLLNLARAQLKNERLDETLATARAVLAMKPESTVARQIVCRALSQRHRDAEALECLLEQPAHVTKTTEFNQLLGEVCFKVGRYQQAIAAMFDALAGDITHAPTHYRLGLAFNRIGLKKEAAECLRTAMLTGKADLNRLAVQGMLTFIERELCRWDHAVDDLVTLKRIVDELPADAALWGTVFAQVVLAEDPASHLRVARSCVRSETKYIEPLPAVAPRPLPQRLRVAFASADFHHHATAMLIAEVLEQLDRSRFEIHLYSYGHDDGSAMRARLIRSADRFIDCAKMSDLEIARHIRAAECELFVDLKGHTGDARQILNAYRAAPVQVSYLGFPGSTGSDCIDYFIGDEIVSPLSHAPYYSEKLALMPRCYQPNDRQRPLPAPMTRQEVGLPEDALVLCGFNQPFKLSPEVFDSWCRMLHALPNAVLWLLGWNKTSPDLLRAQAASRGIDPARLVFATKVDIAVHISRFALADIYVDSWPCNGHTTASDALWAGVPVVTRMGESFASRVAGSLVTAVGLPELACTTTADYERTVIELGQDAPRRAKLRTQLIEARETAPLFDSAGYTRDFGALLWAMAERWSAGLPPEHLIGPRG